MNIRARSIIAAFITFGLAVTGVATTATAAVGTPSPIGSLDEAALEVTTTDATITVRGWAADPLEPTTSIPVHIYVTNPAGKLSGSVAKTTGRRADVAAVYPGLGSKHGFVAEIPAASAGVYRVCVFAIGTPRPAADNPLLACRAVTVAPAPTGSVDAATITMVNGKPVVQVSGWTMDQAVPAQSTQAHVYVTDARGRTVSASVLADDTRTDVAKAFAGAGAQHGFQVAVPISGAGTFRACIFSIAGSVFPHSNNLMGCRSLVFGPSVPIGSLDSVTVDQASATLAIEGWAMDAGMRAMPTQVHVYVTAPDGRRVNHVIDATATRADVARVFVGAGDKHGFSARVPAPDAGVYTVCAYPISADVFGTGHSQLPCAKVTVRSGSVSVTAPSTASPSKPTTGTPAADTVIESPVAAPAPSVAQPPVVVSPPATTPGSVIPSAANTGVIAGSKLTVVNGDITVRQRGTVLQNLDVRGLIRVEAADVVIRNSVVRGRAITGSSALIYAGSPNVSNLLIEDVELRSSIASPSINGVMGSNFTLRRADISGVIDSVHIFGDNVLVESSWMHDNLHYTNDPNWNGGPSHDDSVQVQKGTNIRIVGNSISGAKNAAMQVTQDAGVTSNLTFSKNWAEGGACTVNVAQKSRGAIRGFVMQNNTFGASKFSCPAIIDNGTTAVSTITGNTFYKGAFKVTPR